MKPRIGITTSLEEDAQDGDQQTLRLAYVRAVERAGGLPVIAPMLASEAATRAFARLLDGLVVTGGPAVTDGLVTDGLDAGVAATSGSQALPEELPGNADARRHSDAWLLDAFDDDNGSEGSPDNGSRDNGSRDNGSSGNGSRDNGSSGNGSRDNGSSGNGSRNGSQRRRPVLGICYGMQLVNARRGGRIWSDVERQAEGAQPHSQKRGAEAHALAVEEDTHLHRLLGPHPGPVNTRHVQALASVGAGLRVSASAPDGTIEAIENADGSFIGVQFHPERLGDAFGPLFRHLVARAASARGAARGAWPPGPDAARGKAQAGGTRV